MPFQFKILFYSLFLLRRANYPSDSDWLQLNNFDVQLSTSEVTKITFRELVKIISVSGTQSRSNFDRQRLPNFQT